MDGINASEIVEKIDKKLNPIKNELQKLHSKKTAASGDEKPKTVKEMREKIYPLIESIISNQATSSEKKHTYSHVNIFENGESGQIFIYRHEGERILDDGTSKPCTVNYNVKVLPNGVTVYHTYDDIKQKPAKPSKPPRYTDQDSIPKKIMVLPPRSSTSADHSAESIAALPPLQPRRSQQPANQRIDQSTSVESHHTEPAKPPLPKKTIPVKQSHMVRSLQPNISTASSAEPVFTAPLHPPYHLQQPTDRNFGKSTSVYDRNKLMQAVKKHSQTLKITESEKQNIDNATMKDLIPKEYSKCYSQLKRNEEGDIELTYLFLTKSEHDNIVKPIKMQYKIANKSNKLKEISIDETLVTDNNSINEYVKHLDTLKLNKEKLAGICNHVNTIIKTDNEISRINKLLETIPQESKTTQTQKKSKSDIKRLLKENQKKLDTLKKENICHTEQLKKNLYLESTIFFTKDFLAKIHPNHIFSEIDSKKEIPIGNEITIEIPVQHQNENTRETSYSIAIINVVIDEKGVNAYLSPSAPTQ